MDNASDFQAHLMTCIASIDGTSYENMDTLFWGRTAEIAPLESLFAKLAELWQSRSARVNQALGASSPIESFVAATSFSDNLGTA